MLKIFMCRMNPKIHYTKSVLSCTLVHLHEQCVWIWYLIRAAFVRSLKRFTSRYGISKIFISDNATCFAGSELSKFVQMMGSEWRFILEVSPWWGGFWERLIQSAKRCLRKCLGKTKLSYEELHTVLAEVECVLNSRPLCYIYSDSVDKGITPSHLSLGRRC